MDIHAFLKKLREDEKDKGVLKDIGKLRSVLSVNESPDLVLDIPQKSGATKSTRQATYIHGNVFEDFVLKAAVEDGKPKIKLRGIDKNREDVENKVQKTDKRFREIFGHTMMTKYKESIAKAGSNAWKMLSDHFTMTQQTEVMFEENIKNIKSRTLTKTPRADFVAIRDEKVFLVDFKYSSMERKSYEQDWIENGIVQVLIYGILIGVELDNLKLGILVYYAKEGKVILYEIKHDKTCIQKVEELIIPDDEVDTLEAELGQLHL